MCSGRQNHHIAEKYQLLFLVTDLYPQAHLPALRVNLRDPTGDGDNVAAEHRADETKLLTGINGARPGELHIDQRRDHPDQQYTVNDGRVETAFSRLQGVQRILITRRPYITLRAL